MTKILPSPVLTAHDLPTEELIAATLDGEAFVIGDGFAPVDQIESPTHRAVSLAALTGSRLVAERSTAAWVHGALDSPPVVHEFCVNAAARYRIVGASRVAIREVIVSPSEIVTFGAVRVTSARRTALDLVRRRGPLVEEDIRAIHRLADIGRFTVASLRTEVAARHRLPGKRAALSELDRLLGKA